MNDTIIGLWRAIDEEYRSLDFTRSGSGYFTGAEQQRKMLIDAYLDAGDKDTADLLKWLDDNRRYVAVDVLRASKIPSCFWWHGDWDFDRLTEGSWWLNCIPKVPSENSYINFTREEMDLGKTPSETYLWLIDRWKLFTIEQKQAFLSKKVP